MKQTVQPRRALKRFVDGFDTQTAAADYLKISRSHLNHILAGRKRLTDSLLDQIGLQRVVVAK